jgi:hypothetical protein
MIQGTFGVIQEHSGNIDSLLVSPVHPCFGNPRISLVVSNLQEWIVRCICGVTVDDGGHMIACDRCGVWQHTICNGIAVDPSQWMCTSCRTGGKGGSGFKRAKEDELQMQMLNALQQVLLSSVL